MSKTSSFLGSAVLCAGLLLSLTCLYQGFHLLGLSGKWTFDFYWPHGVLLVATSVPLSLLGAWPTAWQARDTCWTHSVLGLHGVALAPLLLFNVLVGIVLPTAAADLPGMLWGSFRNPRLLWLVIAILGPPAAFLGWCVAGIRLRRWRRQRLASMDPEAGLGWSWAAGLSVGIVALMAIFLAAFFSKASIRAAW